LIESFKNFDWRSLKKYVDPKSADDLNAFLEKLPSNSNQSMIIIAGACWALAGLTGLYTTVQLQKLTEIRAELAEAESLQPIVPMIEDVPVRDSDVSEFVESMREVYKDLSIKASGSSIVVTARSTAFFGQFREAIGHIQNGGSGWRVNVDRLCVGRECDRDPLSAALKINKVSVNNPGVQEF